jgi:hypothetical protein
MADNQSMHDLQDDIAQAAAALVVDEGLDYGAAKQRALRALGLPARTPLPDNDRVESAVFEHIALFHADTQPLQLRALRALALQWMQRLAPFQPLLGGAVWHGSATALSDIYLQLFSDDPKAVELQLLNAGLDYQARTVSGLHGRPAEALSLQVSSPELPDGVGLHLLVNDTLAQRGALQPDARGRKPRGDLAAVQRLLAAPAEGVAP